MGEILQSRNNESKSMERFQAPDPLARLPSRAVSENSLSLTKGQTVSTGACVHPSQFWSQSQFVLLLKIPFIMLDRKQYCLSWGVAFN